MLYKLTVPAVVATLLLHTFTGTGVGAEPVHHVARSTPLFIECKGEDDFTSALLVTYAASIQELGPAKIVHLIACFQNSGTFTLSFVSDQSKFQLSHSFSIKYFPEPISASCVGTWCRPVLYDQGNII
ncbi:hypothetical protein BT96DRAFT_942482 [Gymnopus androsaceus JB14]|uniref:Uncharacterized protein n=1 Tax=Gymnopus androsaceus JB14 TaxID=1447944 RepID=A0A6A4HAR2_9AGAR|nr:hypothetical protein BT96DRAFT_942482 [Gymnopus androsaceus JB14]